MKKIFYIFLFFSSSLFGQTNLVPNFSFEIYDTCPNMEDQIQYATGWSKYSNDLIPTTPDYYNACAPASSFSVPKNPNLYQPEYRNCGAYVGLCTYCVCVSNYREQIGIQLSQPLIVGQKYFISFHAVMGEYMLGTNYSGMPSNNIGVRLSTIAYSGSNPAPIDNFAHLYLPTALNDSINWIRISGSIIADSAYNYIMVGNFFDDINTDTINFNCGSCLNYGSFYLVDDICLSTDSLLCNGGTDTLPCITSIHEIQLDAAEVNTFPNPTSNVVNISFDTDVYEEIVLHDILGNKLNSIVIKNSNSFAIDITTLPSGCYTLKIISHSKNKCLYKKIIKL